MSARNGTASLEETLSRLHAQLRNCAVKVAKNPKLHAHPFLRELATGESPVLPEDIHRHCLETEPTDLLWEISAAMKRASMRSEWGSGEDAQAVRDLVAHMCLVAGQRWMQQEITGKPPSAHDLPHVPMVELPAAFVRRCIVLNLEPEPGMAYTDWLLQRGKAHFGARGDEHPELLTEPVIRSATARLAADRHNAEAAGLSPPGLAELIDLLSALHELAPGKPDRQREWLEWLERLSAYAFVKHREVDGFPAISQKRPFEEPPGN